MKPLISVIICSHNPREDYLERTLQGLRAQTLPLDRWELLLIDNASKIPIAERWDLSWHPQARHIREEELGLTPARLRGIHESIGDLVVFIDDDNVLCTNYLEVAISLSRERPYIGAFGASTTPDFEEPPPESIRKYWAYLALEEIDQDYWGNVTFNTRAFPFGAGLCILRRVASAYREMAERDLRRKQLGRIGGRLGGHEDYDLTLCALDLGLGTGRFQALKLTHLIPKRRLSEDYIVRLIAEGAASSLLLSSFRNLDVHQPESGMTGLLKLCWRLARANGIERKIMLATRRAQLRAERSIKSELSDSLPADSPRGVYVA